MMRGYREITGYTSSLLNERCERAGIQRDTPEHILAPADYPGEILPTEDARQRGILLGMSEAPDAGLAALPRAVECGRVRSLPRLSLQTQQVTCTVDYGEDLDGLIRDQIQTNPHVQRAARP